MQNIAGLVSTERLNIFLIMINVLLAFGLGYIIAVLYKATHKGISYSQSFTQTLVLFSVISAVAMMVIGSSLARAFGLAGALSIIRFRTVVKDPKDIAYLFWSLIAGMACGTQGHFIAIIASALIAAIVILLHKTNFGSIRKHDFILRYYQDVSVISSEDVQSQLQTYLKSCVLLTMNAHEGGKVFEFSFNIDFINPSEQANFLKELSSLKGISNAYLLKATSDIDY